EPRASRVPGALLRPRGRRVAALRSAVRDVRRAVTRDSAQRSELTLASALAPALRARRLPAVLRARGNRGAQSARAPRCPVLQRDPPRRLRHAVGVVGLGGLNAARTSGRTVGWVALVGALATLNYADRFVSGKPPKDVLYQWSTAVGSAVLFGVILGI